MKEKWKIREREKGKIKETKEPKVLLARFFLFLFFTFLSFFSSFSFQVQKISEIRKKNEISQANGRFFSLNKNLKIRIRFY